MIPKQFQPFMGQGRLRLESWWMVLSTIDMLSTIDNMLRQRLMWAAVVSVEEKYLLKM